MVGGVGRGEHREEEPAEARCQQPATAEEVDDECCVETLYETREDVRRGRLCLALAEDVAQGSERGEHGDPRWLHEDEVPVREHAFYEPRAAEKIDTVVVLGHAVQTSGPRQVDRDRKDGDGEHDRHDDA